MVWCITKTEPGSRMYFTVRWKWQGIGPLVHFAASVQWFAHATQNSIQTTLGLLAINQTNFLKLFNASSGGALAMGIHQGFTVLV